MRWFESFLSDASTPDCRLFVSFFGMFRAVWIWRAVTLIGHFLLALFVTFDNAVTALTFVAITGYISFGYFAHGIYLPKSLRSCFLCITALLAAVAYIQGMHYHKIIKASGPAQGRWRKMRFYCCFTSVISISTRRFMPLPSRVLLEPINFWAPWPNVCNLSEAMPLPTR